MNLELFLRYLRYEKNYSSCTVLFYRKDLEQFAAFRSSMRSDADEAPVESDDVRNWIVSLSEQGLSPRTISRKISALRSYYKYEQSRGAVEKNPVDGVKLPKTRKVLPAFVRPEMMDKLLDVVSQPLRFEAIRDKLIISMLYETGMRRAELLGLRDAAVDNTVCELRVLGKRNKERIIPYGAALQEAIEQYRQERSVLPVVSDRFFVRSSGEPMYDKLIYRIVHNELKGVSTLPKKSPHVLRHSFASAMLNDGAGINSVKELLGHSSLASTEVYTHITFEELKQSYKRAHPRAEKKEDIMDVRIQAIHFDATAQLESFIQKKVSKLSRFHDGIMEAEVILKVVKPETSMNKEAALKLLLAGNEDLFSSKVADTFEEAVDLAVEALERQLEKVKKKK
ncbi:MAG: tyrosine-type recombinase/integrase [Bacteroidaceae bacterium]|nr:tyrosine-type recombinase/integrase [Bacteroidaceae bacterium]